MIDKENPKIFLRDFIKYKEFELILIGIFN